MHRRTGHDDCAMVAAGANNLDVDDGVCAELACLLDDLLHHFMHVTATD